MIRVLHRTLPALTAGLIALTACQSSERPLTPPDGGYQQRYEAEIAGADYAEFVVPAQAGQTLAIALSGDAAAHFDLYPPSGGARVFTSTVEQRTIAATLDEDGAHTIRVYLVGPRSNTSEPAGFALDVVVTDPAEAAGGEV